MDQPTQRISTITLVLIGSMLAPAMGQEVPEGAERRGAPRDSYGLILKGSPGGEFVEAPVLETDVHITVRGPVARTRVSQRFSNPTVSWVEGVYTFPLPAGAAVDRLRMVIGERIVEGRIQERQQARKTYETARARGQKTSLVEQERPNVFTTSVANIGPDEVVLVEIEYQEAIQFDDGGFRLRFPMVVGPRYIPGSSVGRPSSGTGWSPDTDRVSDGSRITPPVDLTGGPPQNPVRLEVDLDPGVPLRRLDSPSHALRVHRRMAHRSTVILRGEGIVADRDFVLEWEPAVGEIPAAVLFTEDFEGETYALLMVVPPRPEVAERVRLARETVFVIDTSGSMNGASIGQAQAALRFALDQLQADDEFNVIQFNNRTSVLFESSRQAFPATIDEARDYVAALRAGGGTEMLPALRAALTDDRETTAIRQVVFITDGCVGNEDELFGYLRSSLGRTRLFTVGIGSAPNSHFMEKSAAFGRGTFTYIGQPSEVERKMRELFRKIDSPIVADIEVEWPDTGAESYPRLIPDLYGGEPLVVAARTATIGGEIVLSGMRGADPWLVRLPVDLGSARGGVHQLWARRKIASQTDRLSAGVPRDQVRAEVLPVALRHHLTSRFTSLVAVDVTPSRPIDKRLAGGDLPTSLPQGWTAEGVFGRLPQGGTGGRLMLVVGAVLMLVGLLIGVRR